MITDPITAKGIIPAPMTMPTARAQNKNTISMGSLIAERNLTIERAPTIPRESTTLDVTAIITSVVTRESPTSDMAKPVEYMIPEKVFLYIRKMKSPRINAKAMPTRTSTGENSVTLSKKLDLKILLNVICFSSYKYELSESAACAVL